MMTSAARRTAPHPFRFELSPMARRRVANFRANRRGFFALWIFLALFGVSLFANFIANDRPLVVVYRGAVLFPVLKAYPETRFGGVFQTEADYHDPYVQKLIDAHGFMIWPLIPFRYDTIVKDKTVSAPAPPDAEDWLGTDAQQRDVLARLIYGFRLSVVFGLVLTLVSSVIGIAAGAVQGYFGGWVDLLFQRAIEIWTAIPSLYILVIFAAIFVPNFWVLLGILLLFSWVSLVAVVRAEFLRCRNFEFVAAAEALGVSHVRIMWRHILPNAMVATLTLLPFVLNAAITTLTSLDFLGLGLPPPAPSLGELLREGKLNLYAPWLGLTAFFTLALMLTLLVFIGEAMRDAFDPRKGL